MLPSFHAEFFLGASKVFVKGETYLDLCNEDKTSVSSRMACMLYWKN